MTKISFQFTPSEVGENDISPSIDVENSKISEFGSNSYKIDLGKQSYIIVSFNREIRYVSHEERADLGDLLVDAEKSIRENLNINMDHFDLQIILEQGSTDSIQAYHSQLEELASRRSLGQYNSSSLSSGNVRVSFSTNSIVV